MNLYSVGNSRGFGRWIVSPDEQTALIVAVKVGHIKKISGKKISICDITEEVIDREFEKPRGVSTLLGSETTGVASIVGTCYTMDDILSGVKKGSRWVFREVKL